MKFIDFARIYYTLATFGGAKNDICSSVSLLVETCYIKDGPKYGCVIDRLDYSLPNGELVSRKTVLDLKPKTSYTMPAIIFGQKYVIVEATLVGDGFPLFYPINKEFSELGVSFTLNEIEPKFPIKEALFDINLLKFPDTLVLSGTDKENKMKAFKVVRDTKNLNAFNVIKLNFVSESKGDYEVRRNAGFLEKTSLDKSFSLSKEVIIQPTMLNYENGRYKYGHKVGLAAFKLEDDTLKAKVIEKNYLRETMNEYGASGYHHLYQTKQCSQWVIGDLKHDMYHRLHGDQIGLFEETK